MDSKKLLAWAIIFAAVVGTWLFRFEEIPQTFGMHRNRLTGATCHFTEECWFTSER
jgi:hypothetical protein